MWEIKAFTVFGWGYVNKKQKSIFLKLGDIWAVRKTKDVLTITIAWFCGSKFDVFKKRLTAPAQLLSKSTFIFLLLVPITN